MNCIINLKKKYFLFFCVLRLVVIVIKIVNVNCVFLLNVYLFKVIEINVIYNIIFNIWKIIFVILKYY